MDIQNLRKTIIVYVNTLELMSMSRELSLVKTKLQEAMMWSGNYLKYSGQDENPYAKNDGKRETVKDIQPLFDNTEKTLKVTEERIKDIDYIRQVLNVDIDQAVEFSFKSYSDAFEHGIDIDGYMVFDCLEGIRKSLIEARMWLGMELGRIRDTQVS